MQPSLTEKQTTVTNPAVAGNPVKRILALDVVRGITIAFMIMVNNNGGPGSWGFMNHANWNGLTPTDLVFPTFVFIVGVSIVFAFDARLAKGAPRGQLAKHTIIRAIVLILFGIIVNNFPYFHLPHMRFYGVLQRIGVCYLVVGLFYLWDNRASTKWIALAACLIGYWILLRWIPIPGIGMPGRDVPFMDMTNNLVSWIDRGLFPASPLSLFARSQRTRPRRSAERSARLRYRTHRRSRRPLAAHHQICLHQNRRPCHRVDLLSRHRLPLVPRISAE